MCTPAKVLINTALQSGSLPASAVGYVAVHGTGTPLGDPIEVGALAQAFAGQPQTDAPARLTLGSVKACYGHTEGAAGITGAHMPCCREVCRL